MVPGRASSALRPAPLQAPRRGVQGGRRGKREGPRQEDGAQLRRPRPIDLTAEARDFVLGRPNPPRSQPASFRINPVPGRCPIVPQQVVPREQGADHPAGGAAKTHHLVPFQNLGPKRFLKHPSRERRVATAALARYGHLPTLTSWVQNPSPSWLRPLVNPLHPLQRVATMLGDHSKVHERRGIMNSATFGPRGFSEVGARRRAGDIPGPSRLWVGFPRQRTGRSSS